jgi:hypothetical protein
MPEPKRPLKVFLCHAHADRDAVRALYTRLTNDGVDAWLDKEKLLGGADWEYEIRNAVRESDVVVVCHSKQFNQKGFRQKEVKIALEEADLLPKGEIFIIPVRLEECDVLDDLKRWHWVDLFESDGYERLLRAFRVRADKIGATLQIKRSWLPKITSPLPKKQKLVEDKSAETSDKKIVNTADDISPSSELPNGWEAQWQAGFVKNTKEEKETVGTTDTKVDRPSAKKTRKPNTTLIVSFIVLVIALIFGLPSLFYTPIDESTPTQTKLVIFPETKTLKPSSTPVTFTSTKISTFTPAYTPSPTVTFTSTPPQINYCVWNDSIRVTRTDDNGNKYYEYVPLQWKCICTGDVCECDTFGYGLAPAPKSLDWVKLQVKNQEGYCEER